MLQLHNHSPFEASSGIVLDKDGTQVWVLIIKATFAVDAAGDTSVASTQEPVCRVAEYLAEPGRSSLHRDVELTLAHPGTDVIINASACAPDAQPTSSVEVAVTVGAMTKHLSVLGDRVWRATSSGLRASAPEPFVKMPIVYERAFGGTLAGERPLGDPRNPIGVGFADSEARATNRPLPNIEDPRQRIQHWEQRPEPAGLRAVGADWSPRRELAGTFDEAWKKRQAPLWPEDFDNVYFRSAAPGLWSQEPLTGGEQIKTMGLVSSGFWGTKVPREAFLIDTYLAGRRIAHPPAQLERVIAEPDASQLILVWGSRLRCGSRARQIEYSTIDRKRDS